MISFIWVLDRYDCLENGMHNTHLPRRTRGTSNSKDGSVLKYMSEKTFTGKPNSEARTSCLLR